MVMSGIICRKLNPKDDLNILAKIDLECVLHNDVNYMCPEVISENNAKLTNKIKNNTVNIKQTNIKKMLDSIIVAEINDKIIGYSITQTPDLSERQVPNADYELVRIAVLPEYQSKGVATALWNAVIAEMKQQNKSVLQLAVDIAGPEDNNGVRGKGNEKAIKFYKGKGCTFLNNTSQYKSKTGIPQSKICVQGWMIKDINEK